MLPSWDKFSNDYFETNDHVRLHYREGGEGTPLIIVPGWSSFWASWQLNAPVLAEKMHVYVLDHRGHGDSETPANGYRISRLAMDLYEFIEHIGEEKVTLMGHSMGCSVIWNFIELFGEDKIKNIILIDEPPFLLGNPEYTEAEVRLCGAQRIDPWLVYNSYQKSWAEGSAAFGRYFMLPYYNMFNTTDPDAIEVGKAYASHKFSNEFLGKLMFDHLTQDWRDLIPTIKSRTMLITGDVSHATNPDCAKWMVDAIKDCKWVRFTKEEHGTHSLMSGCPEKFNRVVSEFVLENP